MAIIEIGYENMKTHSLSNVRVGLDLLYYRLYLVSLLMLLSTFFSCSTEDGLEIYEDASGINISLNNTTRLNGLKTGGSAYDSEGTRCIQARIVD